MHENLTRRKFFRGLALAPVVAVVAAKLPALPTKMKPTIHWPLRPIYTGLHPFKKTLYFGFDPSQWRKLHAGEDPRLEPNDILKDLTWSVDNED